MATLEMEAFGLIASVGGFVLAVGGVVVAATRAIDRAKVDADKQVHLIAEKEQTAREAAFARIEIRFDAEQATQDRNFGEVGSALRQFIIDVERKLYQIEIWARDNLASKQDLSALRHGDHAVAIADLTKDVRHLKNSLEVHSNIYKDLNDQVIRLGKDIERISKLVNGKH